MTNTGSDSLHRMPLISSIRSLAWRTDISLLEASGSTVQDQGTHLLVTTEQNPTFHWGNFLLLKQLPLPGGAKEVIGAYDSWWPESRYRAIAVDAIGEVEVTEFEAAGMAVDVSEVLVADRVLAPERPNVDGGLRPITRDEWGKWIDLELSLKNPHVTRGYLQARADAEQRLVDAGLGRRWAVFVDGRIAATAGLFVAGEGVARYQSVATHPRHRNRGMAGTLLHRMAEHARTRLDVRRTVIVADPQGPALGLYRRLGFSTYERATALTYDLSAPRAEGARAR